MKCSRSKTAKKIGADFATARSTLGGKLKVGKRGIFCQAIEELRRCAKRDVTAAWRKPIEVVIFQR